MTGQVQVDKLKQLGADKWDLEIKVNDQVSKVYLRAEAICFLLDPPMMVCRILISQEVSPALD